MNRRKFLGLIGVSAVSAALPASTSVATDAPRLEAFRKAVDDGWMTVDDVRSAELLSPPTGHLRVTLGGGTVYAIPYYG